MRLKGWRLWCGLVGLGVLGIGLLLVFQRAALLDLLPLETRHALVALYSRVTAPALETADMVPIAHTDENPYGINVFLEQEVEEEKVRRTLALIRAAGFRWIRQQVVWGEIEVPTKGQFRDRQGHDTWAKYDRIVDLATEYGLNIILRVDTSPPWARPGNPKLETPPADPEDYADFLETLIRRYRGRVRYYQIWNEPNLAFEWGGQPPDPAGYVRLLRTAYTRAKQVDPEVVIIAAALAPTVEESPRALNDLIYLQRMYAAGARGAFDILGANAYGLRGGPDDRRLDQERDVNFSRPLLLRAIMVQNGDAQKPIWASEIGWNALPPEYPDPPLYGRVSRDLQARYTVRAYQRAQEEWPWMGVMALWHFRLVNWRSLNQQHAYFGIVDEDFTPYPVYEAVRALTAEPPVVQRGYHQERHWALHYTGSWEMVPAPEAVLGGLAVPRSADARLAFRFRGTDLDLVVARQPDGGRLVVTVDGRPAPALPRDAQGRAVLDLASPAPAWQVRVPVAARLPDRVHTVEVVVERPSAGGPAGLDGVVVDRRPGAPAWLPWVAVLGGGGMLVAVALRLSRRVWRG